MKNVQNKKDEKVVYKRRFMEEILEMIDPEFSLILLVMFLMGVIGVSSLVEVAPIEVDIFDKDNRDRFSTQIFQPMEEPEVEKVPEVKKIHIEKRIDGVSSTAASARKSAGTEGSIGSKKAEYLTLLVQEGDP